MPFPIDPIGKLHPESRQEQAIPAGQNPVPLDRLQGQKDKMKNEETASIRLRM